jgi:histone arginine demethylase JMJD6
MQTSPVPVPSSVPATPLSPRKLERVRGLSPREFWEQYVVPGKPALLQDATISWPALKQWTPDFWTSQYGTRPVDIDGKSYTMAGLIRLALASDSTSPAPYYRNIRLRHVYPELMADIEPYPAHCGPNWFHSPFFRPIQERIVGGGGHYELFIGGAGRSFPFLHFDAPGAHTFIHQIAGRKKFILFPPSDTPFLYPCDGKSFSVSRLKNLEDVDLDQFPLYAQATRYEDEAGPGESLFMPCGWWHTARMLSFSISLGIDVANQSNWSHVSAYMRRRASFENPLLAVPYMAYIRTAGVMLRLLG